MLFSISGIFGPTGKQLRVRLGAPVGAQTWDFACVEVPAASGKYQVPATLMVPDPVENRSLPYTYAVKQVSSQTAGAFDASTTGIVSGDYDYLYDGQWNAGPPGTNAGDHYGTRQDLEDRIGANNLYYRIADRDRDKDETKILANVETAMTDADREVEQAMGATGFDVPIPEEDFPATFLTAWAWVAIGHLFGGSLPDDDDELGRQITAQVEWARQQLAGFVPADASTDGTGQYATFPTVVPSSAVVVIPDAHYPRGWW
jgi:hypothetical protein